MTVNKQDVFKYASENQFQSNDWVADKLELFFTALPEEPSAERLAALIYNRASNRGHLKYCSTKTQVWLKQKAFAIIANVEEKKLVLHQLAKALTAQDPPVVLLKGMALNDNQYTSDAPRGTSDVDLLVGSHEKVAFEKILTKQANKIEVKTEQAFDHLFEETWQSNIKSRVYFDVHWYLSYPQLFEFDMVQLFERSVPHPLYKNEKLRVLSNEDQLVSIAIHMMRDCDFYDYGLLDCHEIICREKVDFDLTVNIAKKCGASTCLFYVLWLASNDLKTPIPPTLLMQIKPKPIKHSLCKWLINKWLVKSTRTKTKGHRLKQLVVTLFFVDNFTSALKLYSLYISRIFKAKMNKKKSSR